MTGSLATPISRPAALSDAECEVHGGTSLWPTDSGRTMSRGTSDHPIRRQAPLTWPFLGDRTNSGYVRSFLLLATASAAPSVSAVPGRADPSQCNVEIKVVSTASCAPPNNGSPSAIISNRRASPGSCCQVHIADHDICRDPRTSLATYPCHYTFRTRRLLGGDLENRVDGHTGSYGRTKGDVATAKRGTVQGRCE